MIQLGKTVMTNEVFIILFIAAALTALVSYLIAIGKIRQVRAEISEALTVANTEKSQIDEQLTTTKEQKNSLAEQVRQLELGQQKTSTQLESIASIKTKLDEELKQVKSTFSESVNEKHAAEKSRESAQATVKESLKYQQELQERIESSAAELQAERRAVGKAKNEAAYNATQAKEYEVSNRDAQYQLSEVKEQLVMAGEKYDGLQGRYDSLHSEHTKLKTEQDEREASHIREVANFEIQKESLSEQFKVLSNEIFEAKSKSLQESNKQSLSSVINPFQQSIDGFKKEVQEIHHRETTQQGELRKELESLKELNQKITTEAHELSTALRGQKKLQGNWGELVLENVLDRSGLQLGKDYKREVSFTTEEGRQRPDAVVYLPQNKHLIIDAKVSLNAYTRYVNAEDEAVANIALAEHVKAMGDRIKELADRDYYKLPGLNSPEIVFMFVPIESAFVEALKADETLFQSAIENNVLVATPTTLLTSLNIVRQLWRYEDQNKHTVALATKAETVFKKLNTFLSSFDSIKKGLDRANEAYTKAENQLVSGKGNLVKQVGDFKNLAPAIKAELPSYFTDKAALEVDFIPAEKLDNNEIRGDGLLMTPSDDAGIANE